MWLDQLEEPHSLSSWILFFLERALYIQYASHTYNIFNENRDAKNQSTFVTPTNKMITMALEHSTFWRQFCSELSTDEGKKAKESLLVALKEKAVSELSLER
mmetsp:Transcript_41366/g.63053  ORF Transcript_41366/g.63053 Transcript_41366/m.63053 type:complete len:102 (+) Transcript_41366:1380-1685(+)